MKLSKALNWFRKRRKPAKHFAKVQVLERMSDVPAQAGRDFFIVRREGRDIWGVFQCPCDEGHQLQINLSRQKRPSWKCTVHKGEVSLSPSVWLDYGCKSHFWVHESRIYWVTGLGGVGSKAGKKADDWKD